MTHCLPSGGPLTFTYRNFLKSIQEHEDLTEWHLMPGGLNVRVTQPVQDLEYGMGSQSIPRTSLQTVPVDKDLDVLMKMCEGRMDLDDTDRHFGIKLVLLVLNVSKK